MTDFSLDIARQFRLDGRRALVTGGSKGLGLVIATALAQAGATVAIVSRNAEQAQEAARQIAEGTGQKTFATGADVSVGDDVERMVDAVEAGLNGPIDILFNNAGINKRGPIAQLTEADWDAVVDINLKAPFLVSRRVGPGMTARGWGRIIQLGSIMSTIALPERSPYCSAKAGVLGLTRVLALEWAGTGVTVNALCPGPFATEMNLPLLNDPKKYADFVARIPMGRWGELYEIAGPALFLASEASSFVTGTTLYVDGGWVAQ